MIEKREVLTLHVNLLYKYLSQVPRVDLEATKVAENCVFQHTI